MMNFVRKVANSNILARIIDLPENLRNKKVEIPVFPYDNVNEEDNLAQKPKRARGLLERYKNKDLQDLENSAWAKAVLDEYENS